MTRYSTDRNLLTGCLHRRAKRRLTGSARWMGLGAGEVSTLHLLHSLAADTAVSYATYSFLLALLLAIQSTANGDNIHGLNILIDMIMFGPVFTFETLLNGWIIVDHVLFDIPPDEYEQPHMPVGSASHQIDMFYSCPTPSFSALDIKVPLSCNSLNQFSRSNTIVGELVLLSGMYVDWAGQQ